MFFKKVEKYYFDKILKDYLIISKNFKIKTYDMIKINVKELTKIKFSREESNP